jgi:hypothetical protein
MKLLPVAKDSVNGPHMIKCFALIAAWMGKEELACDTAWHRHSSSEHAQLWSVETFALLGSVAGRPELRKNRRRPRTEMKLTTDCPDHTDPHVIHEES